MVDQTMLDHMRQSFDDNSSCWISRLGYGANVVDFGTRLADTAAEESNQLTEHAATGRKEDVGRQNEESYLWKRFLKLARETGPGFSGRRVVSHPVRDDEQARKLMKLWTNNGKRRY